MDTGYDTWWEDDKWLNEEMSASESESESGEHDMKMDYHQIIDALQQVGRQIPVGDLTDEETQEAQTPVVVFRPAAGMDYPFTNLEYGKIVGVEWLDDEKHGWRFRILVEGGV
jgi:hypothetical protein